MKLPTLSLQERILASLCACGLVIAALLSFHFANAQSTLEVSCSANKTRADVGEAVTWTARVSGGSGNYTYEWSGDENLISTAYLVVKEYDTTGRKDAAVTVRSGGETERATCSNTVTVSDDDDNDRTSPLRGSCTASMVIENNDEAEITWRARARGGDGRFDYDWDGTDNLSGDDSSIQHTYDTSGEKNAIVEISSDGETIRLHCSAVVPSNFRDNDLEGKRASCTVGGFDWITDTDLTWSVSTSNLTDRDIDWSGMPDGDTRNDGLQIEGQFDDDGEQQVTADIDSDEFDTQLTCSAYLADRNDLPNGGDSSCFIATAAFGTPMEPQVMSLRIFRDKYLLTNSIGTAFVNAYYRFSPSIADVIREHDSLRATTRIMLEPLVLIAEHTI